MRHVALDGAHQLGQLVVPLLEQHVDVAPGPAGLLVQVDQAVVERDEVADGGGPEHQDRQQHDGCGHDR